MYTWDNGDTYSGHIVDGVRDGWGLVTSPDNDIEMLSGHWVDGKLTGLGRMVKLASPVEHRFERVLILLDFSVENLASQRRQR